MGGLFSRRPPLHPALTLRCVSMDLSAVCGTCAVSCPSLLVLSPLRCACRSTACILPVPVPLRRPPMLMQRSAAQCECGPTAAFHVAFKGEWCRRRSCHPHSDTGGATMHQHRGSTIHRARLTTHDSAAIRSATPLRHSSYGRSHSQLPRALTYISTHSWRHRRRRVSSCARLSMSD